MESEKENGILFLGKIRAGKSQLIKLLTYKDPKISYEVNSCTKESTRYDGIINLEEKNDKKIKIPFFCIDTPGLSDANRADVDILTDITKFLIDNNIKIKCIVIVYKFGGLEFTNEFKDILVTFSALFPVPDFWERLIFCFTHYGTPNPKFESPGKKWEKTEPSFKNNLNNIINSLKELKIKAFKYEEIDKIFIDSYFPEDSDDEIKIKNKNYRNEFFRKLKKKLEKPIMYSYMKIEIQKNVEYARVSKDDENLVIIYKNDFEVIQYFDKKHISICEAYRLIGKEEFVKTEKMGFLDKILKGGIGLSILGSIAGIGSIALAFIPGGAIVSGVVLASIGSAGGFAFVGGSSMAIIANVKRDNQKKEVDMKKQKNKEIEKKMKVKKYDEF